MEIHETVVIALISAGVGATISSIFAAAGQFFERRHQRKQVVFKSALEVAQKRIEQAIEITKLTGQNGILSDPVLLSGTYYKWLGELYEHGKLPQEAIIAEEASQRAIEQSKEERRQKHALEIERQVVEAARHPLKAKQLLASVELSMFTEDQLKRLQKGAAVSYP